MAKKRYKAQPKQPVKVIKRQPIPKPAPKSISKASLLQLLWMVLMVIMFIPILHDLTSFAKGRSTANNAPKDPSLNAENWFTGAYQPEKEEYLKGSWAYKEFFTELYNQIDFSLFRKINLTDFIAGRDNYLMSVDYIDAYTGKDYMGEDSIRRLLRLAKTLQDTLKNHNIDLVLAYAPGKAAFMPENIPSKYYRVPTTTNHETFVKVSQELGLNYIDFETWYIGLKNISKYPLYGQYSYHWSYYGECLVADSLINYIGQLRNVQMPYFGWREVQMRDKPFMRDDDIAQKMHLLCPLTTFRMGYPQLLYSREPVPEPTKVLGIGDSYYRGFQYLGVMSNVFNRGEYWYYNSKVYPGTDNTHLLETWELDLKSKIEQNQVIVILASDGTLKDFGWGFIQDAVLLYTHPEAYYKMKKEKTALNSYKKQIHADKDALDQAQKISRQKNIPIDSVVTEEARALMLENLKEK